MNLNEELNLMIERKNFEDLVEVTFKFVDRVLDLQKELMWYKKAYANSCCYGIKRDREIRDLRASIDRLIKQVSDDINEKRALREEIDNLIASLKINSKGCTRHLKENAALREENNKLLALVKYKAHDAAKARADIARARITCVDWI